MGPPQGPRGPDLATFSPTGILGFSVREATHWGPLETPGSWYVGDVFLQWRPEVVG